MNPISLRVKVKWFLLATSPGKFGGIRGLAHLRQILSGVGCLVLSDQLAFNDAASQFDNRGNLIHQEVIDQIQGNISRLVEVCICLKR